MMDANCVWEVNQSIEWMKHLLPFNPYVCPTATN